MSPPRAAALSFLLYLALAVVWLAPASLSPWDTVPDLGDPLHLAYVMAWDAHQLVRAPWALFESNSFYPYPGSLAFGDHLLPEALLVAPVNWLTGNAVLASNLGVLLALSLSGLGMCLLVVRLTGSWGAGFLSGLVYAFNSFTRHELARVHVVSLEWWPLGLLFLDRFVVAGGRFRDALALAACLALQGLSGAYYLIYTALIAPLWLGGRYLGSRRWPHRRELARLALAAALSAGVAVLVLWPYLAHFRWLGFEKSWAAGADLLSYLDPPAGSWLWGWIELLPRHSEMPHFLGFLGLLAMLAGLMRLRTGPGRAMGGLALVTAVVGFVLSLGPAVVAGGHRLATGPYAFLWDHARLIRGMASPERVGVLVALGGAVLAGLGLAGLLARLGPRARAAAVAILAVLLPLEHFTTPKPAACVPTGASLPSVYRWLAKEPGVPVIELPLLPERAKRLHAAYLYFSTYHWRPIPIGRTSFYPPAHDYLAWQLRSFPDATSLTLLARSGIRTLVVHPLLWSGSERETRLAALDANPQLRLLERFADPPDPRFEPLGLGEERVYRLEAGDPPGARPCLPADELPRQAWSFESSGRKKPELVRDGDRRTAWFTRIPQRPDDYLRITLPRPEAVAAVALEMYYPHEEFPRNLVLWASNDGQSWRRVPYADGPEERWAVLEELLHRPREARLVLRIAPQTVRSLSLRIGQREQEDAWPQWSVPELRLFRYCR